MYRTYVHTGGNKVAHYQKRGERSFLLVVNLGYDGQGKRERRTKTIRIEDDKLLKTKKRLEDYLDHELHKFKMEVESGEYIQTGNITFGQFVVDWDKKYAKKELAKKTRLSYLEKLKNYIQPRFNNKKIKDINTMQIVNFLSDVSKPGAAASGRKEALADSTVYEIDKTMRVIFNKAVEWRVLTNSPMDGLSRPKMKKKRMRIFEDFEDIEYLIECLFKEPPFWSMFFLTSAIAGYRRGEVVALEWTDVNFDECQFKIYESIPLFEDGSPIITGTKTDDERITDMPNWYMEMLKNYKDIWDMERFAVGNKWIGGDRQFIFHNGFGKPIHPQSATTAWGRLREKYEFENIRLHDLRHTMISYLLNNEVPLFAVSKRAGHSSVKITSDIYGHENRSLGKIAVQPFEDLKPAHFDDLGNKWTTNDIFVDARKK